MIKEETRMEYDNFIEEYVINPLYDWTISFAYKDRYFQFDFVGVPKNDDGSTAYEFVAYEHHWDSDSTRVRYKSLKEAIDNANIEGKTFKEIYEEQDSEIIDIS